MTDWQWESFEAVNSDIFRVTNAGPLLSPIRQFTISRNDKYELILETKVTGHPHISAIPAHPAGTVRLTTETVEFEGHAGISCVASGVLPFSATRSGSPEHGEETTQKAQIQSLAARLRSDVDPAYTIDWLENLDTTSGVWTGSVIQEKQETVDTRTIGSGAGAIELLARTHTRGAMGTSVLDMTINHVRLYLCLCDTSYSKGCKRPGYIFYVGSPNDEFRKSIREVLSFCLGNYLIYLGSTTLCQKSELVTLSAVSPPAIGRIFDIATIPPAPLGDRFLQQVDQQVLSRMANSIYSHYEELQFGTLSWNYWHALCAPVHMGAAHFGAAIEFLQSAYMKSHPEKIPTILIADKSKWKLLKCALLQAINSAALDASVTTILTNKVESNLNQKPRGVVFESFLEKIGIALSSVESAAWGRRNRAAHGEPVGLDIGIQTIRETRLLKILLHRIVLKITGASDKYHDDYTIGQPTRIITEPVPSPEVEVGDGGERRAS